MRQDYLRVSTPDLSGRCVHADTPVMAFSGSSVQMMKMIDGLSSCDLFRRLAEPLLESERQQRPLLRRQIAYRARHIVTALAIGFAFDLRPLVICRGQVFEIAGERREAQIRRKGQRPFK